MRILVAQPKHESNLEQLCTEMVEHVAAETGGLDMIAHPIGVGMFSEEQGRSFI
ncbi:hypothetical protein [Paenibacillus sp. 1001270B_150601_E10]|uniref:hypothetical protein n=1 Tax=Paenibacillus sp. 1001270B_150601_E10 TaxID=2787079 RepID=UPI00189E854A|nr:hypothetical protein [Paenibacillus sp. 1001270B_150601_E10]